MIIVQTSEDALDFDYRVCPLIKLKFIEEQ